MKRGVLLISIFFIFLVGLNFVSADFPAYLQDNIVSCWTLDETSGDTIDYGLGQQNNGTIIGLGVTRGIASQTSSLDNAYYFNDSAIVKIPDSSSLNITGNMTLGVVFNTTDTTVRAIVGKGDIASDEGYWDFASGAAKFAAVNFDQSTGQPTQALGTSDLFTGNDVLLMGAYYAGVNAKAYVNGTLEGTSTTNIQSSMLVSPALFGIGGLSGDGSVENNYTGYISEVWVLNTTINSTDASYIYNTSNIVTCKTTMPTPPSFENVTYENVNVTNNLTIGSNLTASNGFFTNLGLSISRIVKGWFTDIDVSGTSNLTGNVYLTNSSCSSGQVLKTDANGLVSCTNVVNVKSGVVSVTEGSPVVVIFNTVFTNTPYCTISVDLSGSGSATEGFAFFTEAPNTTAIRINWMNSGGSHTENLMWICTDAGNP